MLDTGLANFEPHGQSSSDGSELFSAKNYYDDDDDGDDDEGELVCVQHVNLNLQSCLLWPVVQLYSVHTSQCPAPYELP